MAGALAGLPAPAVSAAAGARCRIGSVLALGLSLPPVFSTATPTTARAKTATAARATMRRRFMSSLTTAIDRLVPLLREQRFDELVGVELDQVVGGLAQPNQLDRDAE